MAEFKAKILNEKGLEAEIWYQQLCQQATDWEMLAHHFPFSQIMKACPQDPIFHGEGDVWTHTKMVVEAMKASASFAALPFERQQVLLVAALLHDIAKPATTVHEWDESLQRERVRQPNHSRVGAHMAWSFLSEIGASTVLKCDVYWLILWHQRPFFIWHSKNMLRSAINYSVVGCWQELLCLVEADNRGRISPNCHESTESLALLTLWLQEHGLFNQVWPFANGESRMQFFEKTERSPYYAAHEENGSTVVLLSGLAGCGKDTYAQNAFKDIPHITLDGIREDLDIGHGEKQGAVIQAAYEQARVFLREKKPFLWNATNLTVSLRGKVISLFRAYKAHVIIHALDKPFAQVLKQNRERDAFVPEAAIARMLNKFEPPSLLEAHEVHWIGDVNTQKL